jgi:predicted kinase
MMVGLPASGKSTYIKTHIREGEFWVSRDAIRQAFMIYDNYTVNEYFKNEKDVFKEYARQISSRLEEGYDVYADATHLNSASREKLYNALSYKPNKLIYIIIEASLGWCYKNNKNRSGFSKVPENEIKVMSYRFRYPYVTEPMDEIIIYNPKANKTRQIKIERCGK